MRVSAWCLMPEVGAGAAVSRGKIRSARRRGSEVAQVYHNTTVTEPQCSVRATFTAAIEGHALDYCVREYIVAQTAVVHSPNPRQQFCCHALKARVT